MTWTHVAVTSDESADGYTSGCTWNARSQLLPAAPACYQPHAMGYLCSDEMCCISLDLRYASRMNDLTRSIGRVQRVPRLVRPWHTLGELGRSQFRVLGAAQAVWATENSVGSGAKC